MKTILLIILFGTITGSVSAQLLGNSQVPSIITRDFYKQYPHAKNLVWMEEAKGYQASFETKSKKYFVIYDKNENTIVQTVELDKVKLPRNIRKQLRQNYNSFIVESVSKVNSTYGTFYVANIGRSEEALSLQFDDKGKLLDVLSIDEPLTLSN